MNNYHRALVACLRIFQIAMVWQLWVGPNQSADQWLLLYSAGALLAGASVPLVQSHLSNGFRLVFLIMLLVAIGYSATLAIDERSIFVSYGPWLSALALLLISLLVAVALILAFAWSESRTRIARPTAMTIASLLVTFLICTVSHPWLLTRRPRLDRPKLGVASDLFNAPITVPISSSPYTTVVLSTDGTHPLHGLATKYDGPLTLERTTILRACAYRWGYEPSLAQSATFIFPMQVSETSNTAVQSDGYPPRWDGHAASYGMNEGDRHLPVCKSLHKLPIVSIAADRDELFGTIGIYVNSLLRGRSSEILCTTEIFQSGSTTLFSEPCGLRMHGNVSRRTSHTKKKSFRLSFRKSYGCGKLKVSPVDGGLFEDGVKKFDKLVLRVGSRDNWAGIWRPGESVYIRDAFVRNMQREMGQPCVEGRFVHLFLNGLYWGVYNLLEYPDDELLAELLGGKPSDWEVVKDGSHVTKSGDEYWDQLKSQCRMLLQCKSVADRTERYYNLQGKSLEPNADKRHPALLNANNYIDYLLLNLFCGSGDWPRSNFIAIRDRRKRSTGFQFLVWDAEDSLMPGDCCPNVDSFFRPMGVCQPFAGLKSCEEFRVDFSDRVQKHLVDPEGALYVSPSSPAWDPSRPEANRPALLFVSIANELRPALSAESARWGSERRAEPHSVNEWESACKRVLDNFFGVRHHAVLDRLRAAGLYRAPPTIAVSSGKASIDGEYVDQIFFTLDGTDPRQNGGSVSCTASEYDEETVIDEPALISVRSRRNNEWSALRVLDLTNSLTRKE